MFAIYNRYMNTVLLNIKTFLSKTHLHSSQYRLIEQDCRADYEQQQPLYTFLYYLLSQIIIIEETNLTMKYIFLFSVVITHSSLFLYINNIHQYSASKGICRYATVRKQNQTCFDLLRYFGPHHMPWSCWSYAINYTTVP